MRGYVYSETASLGALKSLLAKPPAQLAYVMQESDTNIRFDFFSVPGPDWQPWDTGRAFGEQIEIRWQREPGELKSELQPESAQVHLPQGSTRLTDPDSAQEAFQLLVLSESSLATLTQDGWPQPKEMEAQDGGKVYLWGRHRSSLEGSEGRQARHEWVQASIPRALRYPLEARREFAYIETVDYRQQGIKVLTRFQRVSGEDSKETRR